VTLNSDENEQLWLSGQATKLHTANLRSTAAGTHMSQWHMMVAGRASGQTCSHAPVQVLRILVDISEFLNKRVGNVEFRWMFHLSDKTDCASVL